MIILRDKLFSIDDPYTPRKATRRKRRSAYTKEETRADTNGETHTTREDDEAAELVYDEIEKNQIKEKEIIDREVDKVINESGRADKAVTLLKSLNKIRSEKSSEFGR